MISDNFGSLFLSVSSSFKLDMDLNNETTDFTSSAKFVGSSTFAMVVIEIT